MSKRSIFWIIIAGVALPAAGGVGVWTPTGIDGGWISELVIAPSAPATFYAVGRTAGVFLSTDSGATWVSKRAGLEAAGASLFNAHLIAVHPTDPESVYYSALSQGLYVSTDGGDTWESLNDVLMDDGGGIVGVADIAIPTPSPATFYVGGGDGLFKSIDGGATWESLNDVLMDDGGGMVSIVDLAIDPSTSATVWAGSTADGLFKSTDAGASWNSLNDVLTDDGGGTVSASLVAIDPGAPATVYVGGRDGLFKTTDGGTTWSSLNASLESAAGGTHDLDALAIDPGGSGSLVAALEHAPDGLTLDRSVLRSDDGGASWTDISSVLSKTRVGHLASESAQTIWAATTSGVFRTTDGGANWLERNSGLHAALVEMIVPQPQLPPAVATKEVAATTLFAVDPMAGVFKSIDGGISWYSSHAGLTDRRAQAFAMSPSSPQILYLSSGLQFSKSIDGGETWLPDIADMTPFHEITEPLVLEIAVHPTDSDMLLAGNWGVIYNGIFGGAGLFLSSDGGENWERIYAPVTPPGSTSFNYQPTGLGFDPVNPDLLLVGSLESESFPEFQGPVLRSADGGTSWNSVLSGLGFPKITYTPGAAWVTATNSFGLGGGVFLSTDGGLSWQEADAGLPEPVRVPFGGVLARPGDPFSVYLLNGLPFRVHESNDRGGSWRPFDDTGVDPNIGFRSLALVQPDQQVTFYAGYNGGVYSYTTPDTGNPCADDLDNGVVCLFNNRFEFTMTWTDQQGVTRPVFFKKETDRTALVYFFSGRQDIALNVKAVEGCRFNDHWWIWYGGASGAGSEWNLMVRDSMTGRTAAYFKPRGEPTVGTKDETSFPCP